ncbi:MAG: hypothetical protein R2710_16175 [Acidimicrobiales bacterium]
MPRRCVVGIPGSVPTRSCGDLIDDLGIGQRRRGRREVNRGVEIIPDWAFATRSTALGLLVDRKVAVQDADAADDGQSPRPAGLR